MRPLKEFYPFFKVILDSCVEEHEFICEPTLMEVFKNPRLVVIMNHSTPLSWLPTISLLTCKSVEAFAGDRVPRGIVDKWFFKNPFTAKIAEFIAQSPMPLHFSDIVEAFHSSNQSDLVVFPEGAHTFFGDPKEIKEFRSNKFIEIAVRADAPILICIHKGTEDWSFPFLIPPQIGALLLPFSKFFSEGILSQKSLNIPFPRQKIKKLKMKSFLFKPQLALQDLSSDENEKSLQLENEAFLIRELMQDELSRMDC